MSNAKYQDFRGKAMATIVAIESASAFATPEIMAIPEEKLNAFYAECPELETYRRTIYKIRRRAAHILSKEEEALLASAEEMADSADKIGGILRNADLKFPSVVDSEGNEHALTNGSFVPLEESSDRVLRKNAFEAFYGRYGDFKNATSSQKQENITQPAKRLLTIPKFRKKFTITLSKQFTATLIKCINTSLSAKKCSELTNSICMTFILLS